METKQLDKNIIISDNLALLKEQVNNLTNNYYIITDNNLYDLYHELLDSVFENIKYVVINNGEEYKTLDTVQYVITKLMDMGITRNEYIIGFGGGVVLDIVGFIAGILFRGINFISIPTSLLAMVDASVGGKTGVDFGSYKNIIGLFNEPKFVFINPMFLNTLPEDEYLSGFGEIIKYKLLDKTFNIDSNINDLIINSIELKLKYVKKDFYDQGLRMKLNLGHTFGHHIELRHNLSHGVAVMNGIKMVLELERDLNIIDNSVLTYYMNIINKFNIKLLDLNYHDYLDLIFIDKKNIKNTLNLIFIDNDLNPYIYKTTKEELNEKVKNS